MHTVYNILLYQSKVDFCYHFVQCASGYKGRLSVIFKFDIENLPCHFITDVTYVDDSVIAYHDFVIAGHQFTVFLPKNGSGAMCYEVHGTSDDFYNIISDICTSINAHFTQYPIHGHLNRISSIGIHAVTGDNATLCVDIQIDLVGCTASIGGTAISVSRIVGNIRVRKYNNHWRVSVPNCKRPHAVMWITCDQDMLRFDVVRGSNLRPTSHGLLGKSICRIIRKRLHKYRTKV